MCVKIFNETFTIEELYVHHLFRLVAEFCLAGPIRAHTLSLMPLLASLLTSLK